MTATEERPGDWRGKAAILLGLASLGGIVLGFVFDERLFESDWDKVRAYAFGGCMASLAVGSIACGVAGTRAGTSWAARAGLVLGVVALAAAALFLFGTMLVGG